jgi:hypothetical protein
VVCDFLFWAHAHITAGMTHRHVLCGSRKYEASLKRLVCGVMIPGAVERTYARFAMDHHANYSMKRGEQ